MGACGAEATEKHLSSTGLRKLSGDEIIERVKNNALTNRDIIFKTVDGQEISRDSLPSYDESSYFADYYVDVSGEVKEVIMRRIQDSDLEVIEQIKKAGRDSQNALE